MEKPPGVGDGRQIRGSAWGMGVGEEQTACSTGEKGDFSQQRRTNPTGLRIADSSPGLGRKSVVALSKSLLFYGLDFLYLSPTHQIKGLGWINFKNLYYLKKKILNSRLITPSPNVWTFLVPANRGNQDLQGLWQ